jgi:FAD/FMN-containing dehydrogenase/Fe-S oxidoreductase
VKAVADEALRQAADRLRRRIQGEVRFDTLARVLYSTDASNHQVEPLGVVFPKVEDDLVAIMQVAAEMGLPILARGAGTSLAGQAIGRALIVDCSRHLKHVHSIDRQGRLAEVAPGVSLSALNTAAGRHALMFGPDPASGDRATLAGMIGNNASGARSIRYGMTVDHLLAAEVVLSDGSSATFSAESDAEAEHKADERTLEGRIHRAALAIRDSYAEAVRSTWPLTFRRASGYSLDRLTGYLTEVPPAWYAGDYPRERPFNLAPVLCGSEGTLAIVRRATVALVPRPGATALVVLPFREVVEACDFAPEVLPSRPSAVELVSRSVLDRAREVPGYARRLGFLQGNPGALLVIEYCGDTQTEALSSCGRWPGAQVIESPDAQADLWAVRTAGLGLLMLTPGDSKPIPFVEDVAVPVERLGEYVRRVDSLLAEHGTRGEWYAHASAGCLHMRPLINLKDPRDLARMRRIAEAVLEVVLSMRGSLSGEHGDGLSRTEFNARLFGPEVMQAFGELKRAFDPAGLLNPGKIVPDPEAKAALDADLRYGAEYAPVARPTFFSFSREGDLVHAAEACNGQGACLKASGVMCPSFQATGDEAHSTRGRANALRAALTSQRPPWSFTGDELHEVLDLCLECKACKSECPSAVDMARLKAEFLAAYQQAHGVPLRSRAFAEIATLARWAGSAGPLINTLGRSGLVRWVLERSFGLARARTLPQFARVPFSRWFTARKGRAEGEPVVLFLDTYTEFFRPEIGIAAVRVLEACGRSVRLAPGQTCCGRPMISKGLLARARDQAERNLEALAPLAEAGMPIVGLEPSCILTLRDEYLEFFPKDHRAATVGKAACLLEEYLTRPDNGGHRPVDALPRPAAASRVLLHHHCYVRSLVGGQPTVDMLAAAGSEVTEIDAGCCGMAGSFGYEAEHLELSRKIGEQRLLPAVRSGLRAGMRIAAAGVSCRTQILDGTGAQALHPIEVVAQALGTE